MTEHYSPVMPEDYYQRAGNLHRAEQRAWKRALRTRDRKDWDAALRAAERLSAHEALHGDRAGWEKAKGEKP